VRPDHAARRKHFIFTDEHEQLRESIRAFAVKELAPHAEEWEETTFPDWVFIRMGELGFLGLDKPEEYGGQGGDYYSALVLAEEIVHSNSGGLAMGVAVQTDMAMPPILAFGTEEQKRGWAAPAIKGEAILCLGITEPDAGSDVAGIKTRATRTDDGWVINGSKTYITNGHRAHAIVLVTKTDPDAGYDGFTLFLVPMDSPGVIREKRLEKLGMHASDTALLAFQDVHVPDSAVLGQVGKGFYHIMWELQGERLIGAAGCVAGAQRASTRRCRTRSSARRSAARSASSRSRATSSPRWRRRSRPRAARLHDRLALPNGEYPVARSRWPSCTPRASPSRSPTSASRSTAAPATCASTASSACGATCA
jgi:alkylation response protein AidB-like acyl-CoA dehydrogenase